MSICISKHINKDENNRVEFSLVNFDYFDGNDVVAKLFCQEFGMLSDEKIYAGFKAIWILPGLGIGLCK